MAKWKKLAGKIFAGLDENKQSAGLYAVLEDLLALKSKTGYLKGFHTLRASGSMSGDVKSAFKGRGMEMEEIRAYNFGDDVRDIDWRVSARKQQPFTKLYNEERDREVMILLDFSSSMAFGTRKELKSVAAAKVAALLGWRALENKDRVGVAIFSEKETITFKPDNQTRVFAAVCKKIADVSTEILQAKAFHESTLAKPLQWIDKNVHNDAVVFIISDFGRFDEEMRRKTAVLARKANLYMINILDVLEEKAPLPGEYMVENAGQKVVFNSSSAAFQEKYQQYFADKRLKIKDFCVKFQGRYLEIVTNRPLVEQLKI